MSERDDRAPLRVIVTGSRRVTGCAQLNERLGQLPVNVILKHGDQYGIDHEAAAIGRARGWKVLPFPYKKELGKAGGPARNQDMVDSGADLCLAFPDDRSIGTWDCVQRAKAAGIPVEVIHV